MRLLNFTGEVAVALALCLLIFSVQLPAVAQPGGRDCFECVQCLDELTRCKEKRDNLKQGIVVGLGIAAAGGVAVAAAGTGSFVLGLGLGIAGTSWLLLNLTSCTPCHSACMGCDAPNYGGYG